MANSLPRVVYDDLEFDDQLALLEGVPFTGIVYANYPDGAGWRPSSAIPGGFHRASSADGILMVNWSRSGMPFAEGGVPGRARGTPTAS